MKAVVAAFNQEKALVGAFSVITNLRMEIFEALAPGQIQPQICSLSNQVGHFCRGWWDCVMCAAGWARRGLMQITFFSDLN